MRRETPEGPIMVQSPLEKAPQLDREAILEDGRSHGVHACPAKNRQEIDGDSIEG